MKKLIFYITIICSFAACKEGVRLDYIDDSAPAPSAVEVIEIKNTPGGAVIRFKIIDDTNLLGVKAVYTRNGEICENKSSLFIDTVKIEGFGGTQPQEVKLYSIGRNQKLSDPISVNIKPLPPPVETVDFTVESGFGGVVLSIDKNLSKAELSIVLMADTSGNGKYEDMQTFHTKSEKIKFSRRGLKIAPTKFAVYLRDRWNNFSDTLYSEVTPIEEIRIPSDLFRNAALPTDYFVTAEGSTAYRMEHLWIGGDAADNTFYATSHSGPIPQWFTIDLGRKAKLSRIQKWPRADYELYSSTAPRVFEVWGSENPNPDGSWDESWFLIGQFEQFKPSGYGEGREVGPISDEDRDYFYNRTEFDVIPTEMAPDPYRSVTHLRVKILSTFQTYGTETETSQIIIGQLAFWGQLVN